MSELLIVKNGKLKVYNIFLPGLGGSYDSVILKKIEAIKDMGFNAVWFNPFFEVGLNTKVTRPVIHSEIVDGRAVDYVYSKKYKGSVYAGTERTYTDETGKKRWFLLNLKNPEALFSVEANNLEIEKIKKINAAAAVSGLAPLFDGVFCHVSVDSPYNVLRYPMKEFLKDAGSSFYNDVVEVKESQNEDDAKKIFDKLFKEKIDFFIDVLGFQGVRVDSVAYTDTNVLRVALDYIKKKVWEKHGIIDPIIFAEYVGKEAMSLGFDKTQELFKANDAGRCLPFSRFMNCAHELEPLHYRRLENIVLIENEYHMLLQGVGRGIMIVRNFSTANKSIHDAGLTVGFPSTHDRIPLVTQCEYSYKKYHPEVDMEKYYPKQAIERMMKEKILMAMLASDGGYGMTDGDPHGDQRSKSPPFLFQGEEQLVGKAEYDEKGRLIFKYKAFQSYADDKEVQYFWVDSPRALQGHDINLEDFIAWGNKEIVDKIKYPTLVQCERVLVHMPVCLFIGFERESGENCFVAMGNFTCEETHHELVPPMANYIAINLLNDKFEELKIVEVNKLRELYATYYEQHHGLAVEIITTLDSILPSVIARKKLLTGGYPSGLTGIMGFVRLPASYSGLGGQNGGVGQTEISLTVDKVKTSVKP